MRRSALFGLAALTSVTLLAESHRTTPISAQIISASGHIEPYWRHGNVRVALTNGRTEIWTRDGKCELARVSKSGLVGWTHGTAFHSKGALMNDTLIIARNRKVRARMRTFYPFIDVWDFTDADSCVVVLSAGPHGPGRIEKFRIADGQLLGGCYESKPEEQPDWAKRFLKEKSDEGTYVQ